MVSTAGIKPGEKREESCSDINPGSWWVQHLRLGLVCLQCLSEAGLKSALGVAHSAVPVFIFRGFLIYCKRYLTSPQDGELPFNMYLQSLLTKFPFNVYLGVTD